jgi:hypothetical protein
MHLEAMATIEERPEIEHDPAVFDWRFEQLRRAGYSTSEAWSIAAAADADLRLAVRLLTEGCPPETATRILV